MMRVCFLTLICYASLVLCDVELLRNINNVILSEFEVLREKENKDDFLKVLVDRLENSAHSEYKVVDQFRNACSHPLNRSICVERLTKQCPDIPSLLQQVVKERSAEINVTDLFPVIVYYETVDNCSHQIGDQLHARDKPSSAQAWGYGIGFVSLICTIANIGALMAPFMEKNYFQRILLFCVALAVGTLAGTGLLVLIPESMHLTTDDSPIPDYHLKMSTVLAGVYFFYVSERIMKIYFGRNKSQKSTEKKIEDGTGLKDEERQIIATNDSEQQSHFKNYRDSKTPSKEIPDIMKKEVSTVAWMILVGDALHNFVDGIAIGAAFTENVYLGVSVSLAIICEELPHELGDIAILLHAGLSMKRSLCYNFLAAVVCFLGLVIGILVGENSDANVWIFAVAGGMFVYIALVDMLPEMAIQYNHVVSNGIESPAIAFTIQNIGLILGYVIILMLVLYGGNIAV